MELELRKIGNSLGVILPAEVLEALQIEAGDKLTLLPNDKGFQLTAEGGDRWQRSKDMDVNYMVLAERAAK